MGQCGANMPVYSVGPLCLYIIHQKVDAWSGVTDPGETDRQLQNKVLLSLSKV